MYQCTAKTWIGIALFTIILVSTLIRIPLLSIPFERDEGEYAYIGWRLNYEEIPYKDWVDQKPPAIFWTYKYALNLPFDRIQSVHIMVLLFSIGTSACLFFFAQTFLPPLWAILSALIFTFISADPFAQGAASNTEQFMAFPLTFSLVLMSLLRSHDQLEISIIRGKFTNRKKIFILVLSGFFCGIASAYKQVAIVNVLLCLILYVIIGLDIFKHGGNADSPTAKPTKDRGTKSFSSGVSCKNPKIIKTIHFILWFGLGLILCWGSFGLYFFLKKGFNDFIYNVFTHNFAYIQAIPFGIRAQLCLNTLATLAKTECIAWILSVVGIVYTWKNNKKLFLFLLVWLFLSFIGVSASGYYFPHYFQQIFPVIAICAAIGAYSIYLIFERIITPKFFRIALIFLVVFILPIKTLFPFIFHYSPLESVDLIYPGNFFSKMPDVAQRISEISGPNDKVFIFGAEPEIFFYAQRVSASKYIFLFPLYGPYKDAREKQVAAAKEINDSQPRVAFYYPNDLFFQPGCDQFFTEWTNSYLNKNYLIDSYMIQDSWSGVRIVSHANSRDTDQSGEKVIGYILKKE
jgi:hypothetical protein